MQKIKLLVLILLIGTVYSASGQAAKKQQISTEAQSHSNTPFTPEEIDEERARQATFKEKGISAIMSRSPKLYRNVDKFFPVSLIKAGGKPYPLPRHKKRLRPLTYTYEGKTYTQDDYYERNHVAGLLVLQDGKIVKEKYMRGNQKDSRWFSFSVSKPIVTTLVGAAIKQGKIKSVNDYVADYLPEMKGTAYEKVTIRHLLQMSSGAGWDDCKSVDKMIDLMFSRKKGRIIEILKSLPGAYPPGSKFSYNTGETYLLGKIVNAATGMPLSDYLSDRIWSKFAMRHSAYILKEAKDGDEIGGAGLGMTLRDYARFAMFFANNGVANGEKILPDNWIKEATTLNPADAQVQYGHLYEGSKMGYGYQWWIFPFEPEPYTSHKESYIAQGLFGQFVYVNPIKKIVVVIWSSWPQPIMDEKQVETYSFIASIVRQLSEGKTRKFKR